MKKLLLTLIVAFTTVCGFAQENISNNKKLHCHIEGEVKESTFTRILLIIGDGDPRVVPVDTILVKDGYFSHDLYIDEPEFYQLFACEDYNNGCWMPLDFFAEEGDVYATFFGYAIDDAPLPTLHSQTPLNKELLAYKRSIEERFYLPMRQEEAALEKAGKLLTAKGQHSRNCTMNVKTAIRSGLSANRLSNWKRIIAFIRRNTRHLWKKAKS